MSLDYNSRIRTIAERLNLFLRQFKQPEHLDNPAKIERVKATADAINARISASSGRAGLEDRLDATFQRVLETYKGRDWPSVAAFTEAARDTAPRDNPRPVQHGDFTTSGLNASRIALGQAVGDECLFGVGAVEVIQSGDITENDLSAYRSALYFRYKDTLGEEPARVLEASLRQKHDAARIGAGMTPHFNQGEIQ